MEITYLGHSAFRLRGKDVTIVMDPVPPDPGFSVEPVSADIITVSHSSPNHAHLGSVTGEPRVVAGPGEYEIADVLIAGIATANEPGRGPVNTAYVVRLDDVAVCHLGDIANPLTDKQVEGIGSIDVLFVPVGGGDTLGPTEAAEVITQLDPAVVVPMHYRVTPGQEERFEPVEHFAREIGLKEFVPEPKLTLTRSSLPSEVRVVVLQSRGTG